MLPLSLYQLAETVLHQLRRQGQTIGSVESCTGGLIGTTLTEVPGSSDVFSGGLITYSNTLKHRLAHVPEAMIATHGAVSEPVARAMAEGGRLALGVDWCMAATGVAGPGGGTAEKPVGCVHVAIAHAHGCWHAKLQIQGDRTDIRLHTVRTLLERIVAMTEIAAA
jgi:PncC family amidohydrolase